MKKELENKINKILAQCSEHINTCAKQNKTILRVIVERNIFPKLQKFMKLQKLAQLQL